MTASCLANSSAFLLPLCKAKWPLGLFHNQLLTSASKIWSFEEGLSKRAPLTYERPGSVWHSSSPDMLILAFVWRNFWRQITCILILNVFFFLQGSTLQPHHCVAVDASLALLVFVLLFLVLRFIFPPLLVLKCPLVSSASVQLHLFLQLQNLCLKPGRNTSTPWSSNKLYPNYAAVRVFFLRKDTQHLNWPGVLKFDGFKC